MYVFKDYHYKPAANSVDSARATGHSGRQFHAACHQSSSVHPSTLFTHGHLLCMGSLICIHAVLNVTPAISITHLSGSHSTDGLQSAHTPPTKARPPRNPADIYSATQPTCNQSTRQQATRRRPSPRQPHEREPTHVPQSARTHIRHPRRQEGLHRLAALRACSLRSLWSAACCCVDTRGSLSLLCSQPRRRVRSSQMRRVRHYSKIKSNGARNCTPYSRWPHPLTRPRACGANGAGGDGGGGGRAAGGMSVDPPTYHPPSTSQSQPPARWRGTCTIMRHIAVRHTVHDTSS